MRQFPERWGGVVRGSTGVTVAVVADDLTGAGDCAAQFAQESWSTRLALRDEPANDTSSALAVVTGARSLDDGAARAATARAVTAAHAAGRGRLFLKIDSTLRGSVAGQLAGAVGAWSWHHPGAGAVVCPAFPAMGRIVRGGRVLVGGAPAETTAVGRDPVSPVRTSDLRRLLAGSAHVTLGVAGPDEHAAWIRDAWSRGSGIVVVDAETDDDLLVLAAAIAHLGPQAVPVGAGGLARAMAQTWPRAAGSGPVPPTRTPSASRALVAVSSLHEASRAQCAALRAAAPDGRLLMLEPPPEALMSPQAAGTWVQAKLPPGRAAPPVIVLVTPGPRAGERGHQAGGDVLPGLAEAVSEVFGRYPVDALVLVGGDGAQAVLLRLGAAAIAVQGLLTEGVPVGRIEGGQANGLVVATKAGGFGHPHTLADVVGDLLGHG